MGIIGDTVRVAAWPVRQVRRLVRGLTQPLRDHREKRTGRSS